MKHIESYFISKSEYGIINLIVNTAKKWVDYDYNDSIDGFRFIVLEDNQVIEKLIIPKDEFFFDLEKEFKYVRLEQQDKDQVVIYWIPFRFFKGDEFVQRLKQNRDGQKRT